VGVSGQIGKDGVAGSAGAIAGSKVGVGTSATVGNDRNNAKMGAEVSVGPQIGAAVGGGATMDDGRLTVGADVKLALGVGVTLQPSVTVDLKPVQKHVVAPVTNAAKATGNAVKKGAKKLKFW